MRLTRDAQVSVVVPVFNAHSWIRSTLESVHAQTHRHWELVIVDDGSADNSSQVVTEFSSRADRPVHLIRTRNSGPSVARNTGIEASSAPYIAFLDADDVWYPTKLERQLEVLTAQPEAVACICDYEIQRGMSGPIIRTTHFEWTRQALVNWALMEGSSPLLGSSLLIRRDTLIRIGLFEASMSNAEDLDLAFKLDSAGHVVSTNEVHLTYRHHSDQNHRNVATMLRDYRYFLDQWLATDENAHRRGSANVQLLLTMDAFRARHLSKSARSFLRSIRLAPLQWLRMLKGAVTRYALKQG